MDLELPLGQRFRFESDLTPREARKAARAKMDNAFSKVDAVWGFAFGPLVFLQAGLGGSPPALFAWIRQRERGVAVSGCAGLNLAGIIPFFFALAGLAAFGIILLIIKETWLVLAGSVAGSVLLYVIAWSNHIFRKDADHLVHLLRRALRARELEREDRALGVTPMRPKRPGQWLQMQLIVCGDQRDGAEATPETIEEAVETIRYDPNGFIILERDEEQYMQTVSTDGGFILEKREGGEETHLVASSDGEQQRVLTAEEITAALFSYVAGEARPPGIRWKPRFR